MNTLFGNTAVITIPAPKKRHGLLPLLTVLFLVSYGMMTLLIVEQNSVIQTQRNLIKVLMPESMELWGIKAKAIGDKKMAQSREVNPAQTQSAQAQAPSNKIPATQVPSAQIPSTQVPSSKTPLAQGGSQHTPSRAGKLGKPGMQMPPVPASDLVDQRRSLRTI